jgi:sodium/hydrogen antiporter
MLLGPVMAIGRMVSALMRYFILQTSFTTALIIGACLTRTDLVLAASVVGEAHFLRRVPKRIIQLLQAGSGCNDGTSFPFLSAGLLAITTSKIRSWTAYSVSTFIGIVVRCTGNKSHQFSEMRGYIMDPSFSVFYFLLAIFYVGVGSTFGPDDFLVALEAGTSFGWHSWFASMTVKIKLPNVLDLLPHSTMFVYFGSSIA